MPQLDFSIFFLQLFFNFLIFWFIYFFNSYKIFPFLNKVIKLKKYKIKKILKEFLIFESNIIFLVNFFKIKNNSNNILFFNFFNLSEFKIIFLNNSYLLNLYKLIFLNIINSKKLIFLNFIINK